MKPATAVDWVKIRRLFEEGIDLPSTDRAAFVESHGLRDDDRAALEALLAADETAIDLPADRARSLERDAAEPLPEVLGFRVLRRIARGSLSDVLEAESTETGRRCALKLVDADATRSTIERFRQECRVLARLDHPGIARLDETGQTPDGRIYLAMEFIDGACLDTWRREARPGVRESVALACEVLDALSHAHAAGVVHRDLKPRNILVDRAGRARLVDFGVARIARLDGRRTGFRTATGHIVGTFTYMSPEQADGKPERIGPATDVYQVAVVLYELLSGALPYEADDRSTMALLRAILLDPRVLLAERAPTVPARLARVVDGALAREMRDRPQTAAQFAERLRAAVA
ncbi:MAG: Serine/threonine-protein kinase PrkC [Planctomycetota bacterium]|jgi:serine/threonine protein kinase